MMNTAAGIDIALNRDSLDLNILEWRDDSFSVLPLQEFKYKRWDWAYENVPSNVQPLLDRMFTLMSTDYTVDGDHGMKWLVDYKVRDLKAGDCGCPLEGWHLDVVSNPNHQSKSDMHLIYSTEIGTEFLTKEMPVMDADSHFLDVLIRDNPQELENHVVSASEGYVSAYNRFQLHRGPKVKKDCRRMLLRLTATEVIR